MSPFSKKNCRQSGLWASGNFTSASGLVKPRLGRLRRNRQRRNKITSVAIHISSIPARDLGGDEAYLLMHVPVEFLSILSELLRSTR